MWLTAILVTGAGLIAGPFDDYSRSFEGDAIAQETLASERYGLEEAVTIEPEGLRLRLKPGTEETGWKSPTTLRIGGNAIIRVEIVLQSLPTPGQEDGVAVGISVASQSLDQPDATLVRVTEPDGSARYRLVNQPRNLPQQPSQMRMVAPGINPAARDAKPPRPTYPAEGKTFSLMLQRDGSTLRYRVLDAASDTPRDLGQMTLGTSDLIGVKVFALNRNGAEDVDVMIKSVTLHADQLRGLGTAVRTIDGQVVYGEPIGLEDGSLLVGPAEPSQVVDASKSSSPTAELQTTEGERLVQRARVIVQDNIVVGGDVPLVVDGVLNGTIDAAPDDNTAPPVPAAEGSPAPSPESANDDVAPPEPKAIIPLDEIDTIRFERTLSLSAQFLGQPNVDVTGLHPSKSKEDEPNPQEDAAKEAAPEADQPAPPPGTVVPTTTRTASPARASQTPRAEPEPNGIRDLRVSLSGLRTAELTQVVVSCQTGEGETRWRLDTTGSTDWPLVLRRSGDRPRADLFLEPPAGDCKGKTFQINLTYADQNSASLSVQADRSTDPERAFEADQPASSSGFEVRLFLDDGQELSGTLDAMNEESLTLSPVWTDHEAILIPFARLRGVRVETFDRIEAADEFSDRLGTRGAEDVLLARTRAGELVPVAGILEGMEGDRLRMLYREQRRTVPLRLVEGIVFAEGPSPSEPEYNEPIASVSLTDDQTISGFCRAISETTWTLETAWGATLKVPTSDVRSVRFRGTRMTYLSDLEPSQVEQVPYFGRLVPWRRDTSLSGGPLRIDGQTFERGIAVHSYCELTYDLNGRFETFEALVGFDDEASDLGRVDCRVFADEEEIFAATDLRADAPATPLRLSVAGAQTLRLVVDYGPGQNTGDRLIWANARLNRDPAE